MDNVLQNIGDRLTIRIESRISGRISISGFTDVVSGETTTRKVKREFRISQDGLFWSDWSLLNVTNLSAEQYMTDNVLLIEVRYTREGTDTTGTIEFTSIDFTGTRTPIKLIAPTLLDSILSDAVGTDKLNALERNLFKKLYYRGILAQYVLRGDNDDYREDRDFIDLFYSIARFYALFIVFFERWENFGKDFDLLREQVRGYGIYFDESAITLEELQYLAQNLFSQAQQRGTGMIFKRKGDLLPGTVNPAPIDGEFIRLTRIRECDEFLYENIPLWKMGWCLRQSSPMYRGTARAYDLNKTKENTENFQDINNYILSATSDTSFSIVSTDDKRVLRLDLLAADTMVGLGRLNEYIPVSTNLYTADSKMSYEITFAFRLTNVPDPEGLSLIFGVEGFDINGENLRDAFIDPNRNVVDSNFFVQTSEIWQSGVWYHARGIIHAYSTADIDGSVTTNLGIGHDLYFNNSFVKYILPKIQIATSSDPATVDIWDYKIRPLVRGRNIIPLKDGTENSFSLGFIQSSGMFHTYFRNNNNSQSQEEVTDIIERYLYPFDTVDVFTIMSNN